MFLWHRFTDLASQAEIGPQIIQLCCKALCAALSQPKHS